MEVTTGAPNHFFDGAHLMVGRDQDLEDLHTVAAEAGLEGRWFQNDPHHPHYDVWGAPATRLEVNCTSREMIERCRR